MSNAPRTSQILRWGPPLAGHCRSPSTPSGAAHSVCRLTALALILGQHPPGTVNSPLSGQTAVAMHSAASRKRSRRGRRLRGVLDQVTNSLTSPLDIGEAMRPPTLLVRLRDRQATWKPNDGVIMDAARLVLFSDPDVARLDATAHKPLPHSLKALRQMARLPVDVRAVGERDERPTERTTVGSRLAHERVTDPRQALEHAQAASTSTFFLEPYAAITVIGARRVTCYQSDKPSGRG